MSEIQRKSYSKEEINIIVAEQLKLCIEPICYEIGKAIESLQARIVELEHASNALIKEMQEWKAKNSKSLQ